MKAVPVAIMMSILHLSTSFAPRATIHAIKTFTSRTSRGPASLFSSAPQQTLEDLEDGKYYEADQVIKRSHFIGVTKHCTTWESAQEFVDEIRAEHPKARHVCFAFVGGFNPKTERCSDDGEPTGTAGVPILGGINGEDLSDTVCAVVRYSGGIKLGAGGLIRAYGGTARMALRAAEKKVLIPKSSIRASTASSNAGQIYATVTKYNGIVGGESYNEFGELEVMITCDTSDFEMLCNSLTDATRGNIKYIDEEDDA